MRARPPVIVVGAGPAGCAAALALRQVGVATVLLERCSLPRPKTCAGGLSPWTLAELERRGLRAKIEAEAHPIRGATIVLPRGGALRLRGRLQAAVLPRDRLDALLADAARHAGAELRDGVEVTGLAREGERVVGVHTAGGLLEASAVVVAVGAGGRLGPRASASGGAPFFGVLARYAGLAGVTDEVELYFDEPGVAPHYAWVFPEGGGRANVGVCFRRGPGAPGARVLLERFVERRLAPRLRDATRVGDVRAHPIAARVWPRPLVAPGAIWAGEAAGLVDPLTGEGIYHALVSGRAAGALLADLLAAGHAPTSIALAPYARVVRARLGPGLALGEGLRRAGRLGLLDAAGALSALGPVRDVVERLFRRV